MLTCKFDFNAPEPGEEYSDERAKTMSILADLFPDKKLRSEAMTAGMITNTLCSCTNGTAKETTAKRR